MKNKILLSAAILLTASCSQMPEEIKDLSNNALAGSFEAVSCDDFSTKATFGTENSFNWQSNDRIGVLLTNGSIKSYRLASGVGESQGRFSGSLSSGEVLSDLVAFPLANVNGLSSGNVTISLPATYAYGSPFTFGNGGDSKLVLPCFAKIVNNAFKMKHLGGYFVFEISKIPAGANKFEFLVTNGKRINGSFSADLTDEYPQFTEQDANDEEEQKVTVTFTASETETTRCFIIPVPPGSYSYEWTIWAGNELYGFGEQNTPVAIPRGKIKGKKASCSNIGGGDPPVAQNVSFEDNTFKAYMLENFDENGDGVLSIAEAEAVTTINCSGTEEQNKGITSLKGIEYCTNLTKLFCSYNQLTSIDLSKNVALTELRCFDNLLTQLDLIHNLALTCLYCDNNRFDSIDLSNNAALTELYCSGCDLIRLDLSHNVELEYLGVNNNSLTSLDLSNNTKLKYLNSSLSF